MNPSLVWRLHRAAASLNGMDRSAPWPTIEREIVRIAAHESGHHTVATVLGFKAAIVNVAPTEGLTHVYAIERADRRARAAIGLAGSAAEFMATRGMPYAASQLVALLRHVPLNRIDAALAQGHSDRDVADTVRILLTHWPRLMATAASELATRFGRV